MSDPYIGEIRAFPYIQYIPEGWLLCDGSSYQIRQFPALASILGSRYGGDNMNAFNVPNLVGRTPVGASGVKPIGKVYGQSAVTLTESQLPAHFHLMQRKVNAKAYLGKTAAPGPKSTLGGYQYMKAGVATNLKAFNPTLTHPTQLSPYAVGVSPPSTVAQTPHSNLQPYVTFYFGIAYLGIYPSPE